MARKPKKTDGLTPPKPAKGQFIDTDTITAKDVSRIKQWAKKLMLKHEWRFKASVPDGYVIVRDEIKPEDLDISQIFDFKGLLTYVIFKRNLCWCIRIMFRGKMIIESCFEKF